MIGNELLEWMNKIIVHCECPYLWRELSEFDLELRKYIEDVEETKK